MGEVGYGGDELYTYKSLFSHYRLAKMELSATKGPLCQFHVANEPWPDEEVQKALIGPKEGMPHVPKDISEEFIKGIHLHLIKKK